jgi:hypothetical protein
MADDRMQQLAALRKEFDSEHISKRPQVNCYWCTQANKAKRGTTCSDHRMAKCAGCGSYITTGHIHLDYVGHAEATDRLLDVDLEWNWEPVAWDQRGLPAFDDDGGLWVRLTVAGVPRLGYGSADGKRGPNATKEIIGDAIRNAGMRFGMALNLWAKTDLHADERDSDGERLAAHQDVDAEESQDPWASEDELNKIAGGLRALRDVNSAKEAAIELAKILGREIGAPNQITQGEAEKVLDVLRKEEQARAKAEQRASEAAIAEDIKPKYASATQLGALKEALSNLGIDERIPQLAWCGSKLGRQLGAMKDITVHDYHQLTSELATATELTAYNALMLSVKDIADGEADVQGVDADIAAELAARRITEEQAATLRQGLNAAVDNRLAGAR